MSAVRFPAPGGRTVVLEVDGSTGLVTVLDPAGQPTWAQAGTHAWALRCAGSALADPARYVRHHITPAAARCECGGSGILWGQTYGTGLLSPRELPVQSCDLCDAVDGDEAAARAAARLLVTSYRFAPPAGGSEAGDDPDDPPGEWVVELPHGLVAVRETDGEAGLLVALADLVSIDRKAVTPDRG